MMGLGDAFLQGIKARNEYRSSKLKEDQRQEDAQAFSDYFNSIRNGINSQNTAATSQPVQSSPIDTSQVSGGDTQTSDGVQTFPYKEPDPIISESQKPTGPLSRAADAVADTGANAPDVKQGSGLAKLIKDSGTSTSAPKAPSGRTLASAGVTSFMPKDSSFTSASSNPATNGILGQAAAAPTDAITSNPLATTDAGAPVQPAVNSAPATTDTPLADAASTQAPNGAQQTSQPVPLASIPMGEGHPQWDQNHMMTDILPKLVESRLRRGDLDGAYKIMDFSRSQEGKDYAYSLDRAMKLMVTGNYQGAVPYLSSLASANGAQVSNLQWNPKTQTYDGVAIQNGQQQPFSMGLDQVKSMMSYTLPIEQRAKMQLQTQNQVAIKQAEFNKPQQVKTNQGVTIVQPLSGNVLGTYDNGVNPDTVYKEDHQDTRAANQNQTSVQVAGIHASATRDAASTNASGRVKAATVSASKPHFQQLDDGSVVAIDPKSNVATPVTDKNGQPIIGKQAVGPEIMNAKIDAAKEFVAQHPRMIPDPANPGKMKPNPEVLTISNYDATERLANTHYVRKTGGNIDTVPNPLGGGQSPAAPHDPRQRTPGTVYMTPKGAMKWTGTGWLPQ